MIAKGDGLSKSLLLQRVAREQGDVEALLIGTAVPLETCARTEPVVLAPDLENRSLARRMPASSSAVTTPPDRPRLMNFPGSFLGRIMPESPRQPHGTTQAPNSFAPPRRLISVRRYGRYGV